MPPWRRPRPLYAAALRLRPGYAEAHNNLGAALAAQGKTADARAQLEQALRFRPNYAEAHFNLGALLISERRLGEATAHFIAGLQINPEYAEAHMRQHCDSTPTTPKPASSWSSCAEQGGNER